ncbi:MAG TPA: TonB family protein [Methylomirabilota bacterium]|nr:TonB family protein [Methylomirabilota bacterium]
MMWRARLPKDPAHRALVAGLVCSLLLHVLAGAVLLYRGVLTPVYVKRGEPLFVDIAPDKPQDKAPLGNPSRPPGPEQREAEKPNPPAPKSPEPAAPKPRLAEALRLPAQPKAPEPPKPVAKAETPEPGPKVAESPSTQPPEGAQAKSAPAPAQPPSPPAEPLVASRTPEGMWSRPGGGGGLRGGRGGVEGDPIPLDTPEPRFQEYFEKIRAQIKAKWVYPYEAGSRGIEGDLNIEFHIAKDGRLALIELRRSSGVEVLDLAALNAVKLAQPFPPVPDALSMKGLPINGLFVYRLVDEGSTLVKRFR